MINQFKGNRSDHWATPKDIYDEHIKNGYIDYNPLNSYIDPFYKNACKYRNQNIFINPPFSILNKEEWILTIKRLLFNKNHIKILMPARVDTKQFHTLLELGFNVQFIKGRLKYNDTKSAPFPTLWLIYGEKKDIYSMSQEERKALWAKNDKEYSFPKTFEYTTEELVDDYIADRKHKYGE